MARVELPITVINSSTGLPVPGASIAASYRSNGAPAPWWTSETGGSSSTSAIITDSAGRANAWLERGAYNLAVTGTGITPYTEPWDAIPASDNTFDIALIPDGTIPLSKLVAAVQQSLMPVGTILPYAGSAAPTGYLMCDGTASGNRTTHAALFAVISTTYGAGDGSTTFGLPNLRGRVPVGRDVSDAMFDALGEVGGEKTHLLTAAESGTPAHTHTDTFAVVAGGAHQHGSSFSGNYFIYSDRATSGTWVQSASSGNWRGFIGDDLSAPLLRASTLTGSAGSHTHTLSGAVAAASAASAASAHNIVQPYQVVNFIIKY